MQKLTVFQKQVLIGLLLGNGSLQNVGKNYRLRFIQSDIRKDYGFHLYNIFKEFVRTPPKSITEVRFYSGEILYYKRWYFNTLANSCFKPYADLFYSKGKKRVPKEIIELIDPIALAYWFMNNGSRKSKNYKGFRLCTDIFNLEEVLLLQQVLNKKFCLKTSIIRQRSNFRIAIKAESHDAFISHIKDEIIDSMRYLIV